MRKGKKERSEAMTRYQKGARSERELIGILSNAGFSVIRAAGSGVSQTSPPDILAFKKNIRYAFECKAWDKNRIAISHEKFEALKKWEENTDIITMIAWKIPYRGWLFARLDELELNAQSYSITRKEIENKNRTLENIVRG